MFGKRLSQARGWQALLAGTLLLTAAVSWAGSGRGLHKKIYAVPAPGPVKIDGRLDDWDLSGQLFMYVMQETSEMQSARFAIMYDKDNLYLSAVVRDPSPMMNRHDPKVNGDKGWDADACQFRMILDPAQGYPVNQSAHNAVDNDQMAHLILWYYTDRQEPCLQMHYGMTYKVPRPEWAPFGVIPASIGLRFLWAFGQCRLGRLTYRQPQDGHIFFAAKYEQYTGDHLPPYL